MKPSDIAAWWGAILATIAILWDVVKWKHTRTRLFVDMKLNFSKFYPNSNMDETATIELNISNTGDQTTTIKRVDIVCYKTRIARFLFPASAHLVQASTPSTFEIAPGAISTVVVRSYLSEFYKPGFHFYIRIRHTKARRAKYFTLLLPAAT